MEVDEHGNPIVESDEPLTEEELDPERGDVLLQEAPEPRVVIEQGKAIQEDGTIKIAVMRPCISRGRRIRNMPPIYTPQMLARNAKVMEGWPMFMGHLPPQLVAVMAKYGRTPLDLGGRITESWYDPEHVGEDDSKYGYQKGAIVAKAIPYEAAEKILERDPAGLHTSINAWPTGAKPGSAPWKPGSRGMVLEGIRPLPVGSVDFVIRGGAGGRVLTEEEEAVVSLLESVYGSAEMELKDIAKMNREQFREYVQEHASHLSGVLIESSPGGEGEPQPATTTATVTPATTSTSAATTAAGTGPEPLTREALDAALEERDTNARETAENLFREREEQRSLERRAHALIEEVEGLPRKWKNELKARYAVLPSGPTPTLLVEAEVEHGVMVKTTDAVLEEQVKADIEHTLDLIREVRSGPHVRGQGGRGADADGTEHAAPDALVEFMVESGDIERDKPEQLVEKLAEHA